MENALIQCNENALIETIKNASVSAILLKKYVPLLAEK